jgi:PKD repeat protein
LWNWNFGDGITSNSQNPNHVYANPGTYTVTETITNAGFCPGTNTQVVTVNPYPSLAFALTSVCSGINVPVINTSTISSGGINYSWLITGGTPNNSNVANPIFSYATSGNYTVNLTGTSNAGCVSNLSNTVAITPAPIANFIVNNTACSTATVSVISTSSLNGGAAITNYQYDWNDLSPNSLTNPATHTYSSSGSKSITLLITSASGCTSSATQNFTVTQSPIVNYTFTPLCMGSAINFTNTSSTPAGTNSYTWNYGDASVSNVSNPSHTYSNSGTYSVTLIATNTDLCTDSIKKVVNVYGTADVDFLASDVCFNTPTSFTNITTTTLNANTGAIASYSWNFGAIAGSSSSTNPIYTYTNPANATANTTYSVTLFATTIDGCKDSITKVVTVYSLPTPTFVADSVCNGSSTTLTDVGNNNGNPYFLFNWSCNSLTTPTITNVFPTSGNNSVTYTVITSPNAGVLQCKSVFTKNVWVRYGPYADITFTNQCAGSITPIGLSGVTSTVAVGTITNYAWDYGNATSSLVNPTPSTSVSYSLSGTYIPTLTVTSSEGCTNTAVKTVTVFGRADLDFLASDVCFGTPTSFTNITTHYS